MAATPTSKAVRSVTGVTVRLAGDSGDGMQLLGTQLTNTSALAGNDVATFPDFPAEIRAPRGTRAGVSGFQVQFASEEIFTPGDTLDALVVMNPAAMVTNLGDLRKGGILIANEDEALAYTGHIDEALAIQAMAADVKIAVLKVGERGSLIACGNQIVAIRPKIGAPIIDTTGAGDLWAAGFLYGLVNGYTLEKCGELGSACGYEVCRVVGANIPDAGWERIRKLIE